MTPSLVFIISPPRAGSTLLQRMLGAHDRVFTHPEPHLISPAAHLGYFNNVDKAPFDHINAAEALRLFVSGLPNGEQDYLAAVRAYTDTMYGKMLQTGKGELFVDKTPANALVLPFLTALYPDAKYILLTRHPLAVFSSYANSFFNGDWQTAHAFNPILERYVPAMAKFVREQRAPLIEVAYETLVEEPEQTLARVFAFLGIDNDPRAVDYGDAAPIKPGMGDPITVDKHSRPTADSMHKWAAELSHDADKKQLAEQMLAELADADLEAWGWPRQHIWSPLGEGSALAPPKPVLNSYTLKRRIMLALKKDIHNRPHGRLIRKIKYYCDVLLRE